MSIKELTEVCRLCLKIENLVWIFDERFETKDMKDVVFITTGIEVSDLTDQVIEMLIGVIDDFEIGMII